MIIHLNGWPGVGKLTVARGIVHSVGGCLLDNHTIYNLAFSLTEFRTPAFYDTVRAVRDVAYARVLDIDPSVKLTVTNALSNSEWGRENWEKLGELASKRGSLFLAVTLHCSLAENVRRLRTPERALLGKLIDPVPLTAQHSGGTLIEEGADHLLQLDTTEMTPEATVERIVTWVQSFC
jgi:hypothetical protein